MDKKQLRIETKCVQGGYTPANGEPRQIPIVQSTTYRDIVLFLALKQNI